MFSFHHDQAAGLRRIMAEPKPRIVSVLSALGDNGSSHAEASRILANLAASLGISGYLAHVIYAAGADADALKHYGLLQTPAINELLLADKPFMDAFSDQGLGFTASRLSKSSVACNELSGQLNDCVHKIAQVHDIVLVQTTVTDKQALPLNLLNEGTIIVQLNTKAASITQAYRLIKQLYGTLGSKPFGILVHGASAKDAEAVFKNIDMVARQFLGIKLAYMGHIPSDEHMHQASKMGRSVVDAFPGAMISKALKALAHRLLGHERHASELDSNSMI